MPTNLPLRNRSYPAHRQIDRNGNDPDNPNSLLIILALIPENDRKDDTPQITNAPRAARDDAVRKRVHVRHETEDGAVGALEEERHAREEAEHGALVVAVRDTDGDLEDAREDGVGVDEVLLAPDAGAGVDGVGQKPAHGPEGNVQETEHGGPATGAGLTERFEVFQVVGAEDGVDGQFRAEGAEVAGAGDEGLEGEDDGHCFLERGFADNFAPCDIKHLLLANLGFVVEATLALAGGIVFELCIWVPRWRACSDGR